MIAEGHGIPSMRRKKADEQWLLIRALPYPERWLDA